MTVSIDRSVGVMHHLSYVRVEEDLRRKMGTFSHAGEEEVSRVYLVELEPIRCAPRLEASPERVLLKYYVAALIVGVFSSLILDVGGGALFR